MKSNSQIINRGILKNTKKILTVCSILTFCLIVKCSDKNDVTNSGLRTYTDAELFNLARAGNFNFYKNNSDTLPFIPGGGGHSGFIRVKFNAIAFDAMIDNGKLPNQSTFPNGSLIVKEIYNSPGEALQFLAVMLKDSTASNAAQNWVWGEYFPDGRVLWEVNRGADCVPCHSFNAQTSNISGDLGHRDYVRTFGLRP